ncbi:glycosyltransferase family 4 protein [Chenggangzhangella methanolivorans]|uniref:Glycosyltransferase family 1 protein n=1 Tax=Chenggangzhangella methanolivorans TaxID=1437009 RepID=A0A9E6R7K8_9HYPH|nr:glycosyltransferase family 1 protein [Chenggangzhangella methanolivorans]QZN99473.1 glycosyltransferase family 1 protein [Chenggangzhangella methanolivorans]
MRVLVVTDAWRPQVNGVVRTIEHLVEHAPAYGAQIDLLTPQRFRTVPMPTYPEIRLSLARTSVVSRMIAEARPDNVHISTEGPLGIAARRACLKAGIGFTTSYHTRFPEYLRRRAPVPERWTYAWLRRFHNAGDGMMVATRSLSDELSARGFQRLMFWGRGVDADRFRPRPGVDVLKLPRPIFLYVGRVATEKNIEGFLALDLPGSKVVVGDGPARRDLEAAFPDAHFTGSLEGEALAEAYSSCDVFVFPSRTDTFGIVILEALASGLPVAAFPVTGPVDILAGSGVGALDEDLRAAALAALDLPKDKARAFALHHGWADAARVFVENVASAMELRARRRSA